MWLSLLAVFCVRGIFGLLSVVRTGGNEHTLAMGIVGGGPGVIGVIVGLLKTLIVVLGGVRFVQVGGADGLMVGCWMVLGEVIGLVQGTFPPVNDELSLTDAVTYPIESHVNGLGPLLF